MFLLPLEEGRRRAVGWGGFFHRSSAPSRALLEPGPPALKLLAPPGERLLELRQVRGVDAYFGHADLRHLEVKHRHLDGGGAERLRGGGGRWRELWPRFLRFDALFLLRCQGRLQALEARLERVQALVGGVSGGLRV